ncbi:DUF262 domain-containing protein [Burkholderia ubonensis]|nr:DUF262 domain-containing protein [Burkholderia ubonensis]KVP75208.1 hypothetical protein WJ93_07270 [Burkholderia ubonensis]KVP96678.1 hypothetical protein WJ97_12405 [Burkholderia ubonensis]KVZ92718.1 hypothetical protein WL25_17135 [Burkholderia ubonensis]
MRIEQHSSFLSDVLKDALNGRLVPAAFQRPYVWGKADVLALCESILRGYPFGSFLIWSPHGKADLNAYARARLGPILRSTDGAPTGLLLDGQNRLASFAWMTQEFHELPANLSEAERATWGTGERLIVDLALREMRFVPEAEANTGFSVPAYTLLDSRVATRLMRERWVSPEWTSLSVDERNAGLKWWDEVASARFGGARVVVTVLESATPEEAREAFTHICRVGVPMSEADFDAALKWTGETP